MANVTFNNATIKPRGDTASNWSSVNPILAKNEVGYDETNKKFKIGDGTTPWNSLSYIEGSPQTVIELDGIMDIFSVEYPEINFRASDWEQFVNNKYVSVVLHSPEEYCESYTLKHETLIDNEDGSWYAMYRYEYDVGENYILTIHWSEDDMYIDDFYKESCNNDSGGGVNLEPIKIAGSIDWENYDIILEFTEENYQQFLKNKTAPVAIENEIYNLSYVNDVNEDSGEQYCYYKKITEEKIYTLGIGWNPIDYGYSDEYYDEEISSSVLGKAVLSYTMSPDDVIQLSEEAKTTINKYGVENIIFKINDGAGYTYYLELSILTDDPLYRYEYLDGDNNYCYIDLETDFSSITFTFMESQPDDNQIYYQPIEIGGTITEDDGDSFVIQNPSITEENYQQFLQNKNAPIKIGTQVFQLEDLSSSSNSYNATYTLLKYFYAFGDFHLYKIHITIVWGPVERFLAQTFLRKENVVQNEPIILPGNDTGFTTKNWSLTNVGVSQSNYQQFLRNKLSPVQIGDNVYQLNYFVEIPDLQNAYAAGYALVRSNITHWFYIRWEDENSSITTYSTNQYAASGDLEGAMNFLNSRIDDTNEEVEILNAKTQELYDKVFSGIANDPARIYDVFYFDSSQTYYVKVNRALEEGGYIKLGQDPSDASLSLYVYRIAATDNYWFSVGNYNDTMSKMTLVDEANSIYSFTIASILDGYKIQPSAEEETTLAYFVDIDAIGETPETETSGTGLNIYPLPGFLNFDNPTLSITNSQLVEIKNANAISCSAEVSGLGQCNVILYICSNTTNYICFTDAMFIIEGQKFYVRKTYIDVAALTLNFTPDA